MTATLPLHPLLVEAAKGMPMWGWWLCDSGNSGLHFFAMAPEPESLPDFSPFHKMRDIELDPESVVGKELRDRFAYLDQSFTGKNALWAAVVKLIGLTAMCAKGVIDLEKEVIELKREVRSRRAT